MILHKSVSYNQSIVAKCEAQLNSLGHCTHREQEVEGEEEIFDDFHGALHLERRRIAAVLVCLPAPASPIRTVVRKASLGRLAD